MHRRRLLGAAAAVIAAPRLAIAQNFPDKPVRVVVPYAPGGSTDTGARALAPLMEKVLGQPIVVENKPGGGTIIATEFVAKAKPDGYTILLATGALTVNAAHGITLPYDTFKDLTPVAHFFDVPIVIAAAPTSPYQTLAELLAAAKDKPVNYATGGAGAMQHLWTEDLKQRLGLKLEAVTYKGSSEALRDVMAGHVPVMFDLMVPVGAQVKAGKLRGLAVALPKRAPLIPDVPTLAEAGVAGAEGAVFNGFVAPAGTPPAVIAKLNGAINQAMADPEIAKRLNDMGLALVGGSAESFGKKLAEETAKWRKVIKDGNIAAPS
jgi:tripartite-type tricarboxylate transporter receptor subunit TctC